MTQPKMVYQVERSECALACIAMIADYHGCGTDLPHLRMLHPGSARGTTFSRIIDVAGAIGLTARPLKAELHELHRLRLPAILHWEFNHYVVLREVNKHGLVVLDPARGIERHDWEAAGRKFTGAALEFEKGPTFQPAPVPKRLSLRRLLGHAAGLRRSLAHIFALALVLEALNLVLPQFSRIIVDQVIADADRDLFLVSVLGFSAILLAHSVTMGLRSWTLIWINNRLNLGWTANVFRHLMRLPQDYFQNRHLGDIASRFGAINVIQQALTSQFVTVILDGLMAVGSLVFLFLFNAKLTSVLLAVVSAYAISRYFYFRALGSANVRTLTIQARQQSVFLESVRGIETLRSANKTSLQSTRYLNLCVDYANASVKMQKIGAAFGVASSFVAGSQRIAVVAIAALLAIDGRFTAGLLIAFSSYADMFSTRVCSLVDYAVQLRLLRAQADRLADIVNASQESGRAPSFAGTLPDFGITLRDVGFRYSSGDPWILQGVSLDIRPGEHVAIIGASGEGKTTLLKILMGAIDPTVGTVSVGGVELRALGKERFRDAIGCVFQEDRLFAGTIAENIAFFDPEAVLGRVEESAKMAGIHDDIVAMPMGYRTLVGDMGSALSGGQQQRIVLARALYRMPKALFLDEATSHLDVASEKRITANVARLNMTRIVVAHRTETIAASERAFIVKSGRVMELQKTGPAKEKIAQPA
jgi:ATP-binding cassette subfamily B protein RaxB